MAFTQFFPGATLSTPGNSYTRMLDANGDYTMGQGYANWWGFQGEGVAQSVYTRLKLNQGDWFLDTQAGMPWNTRVLGKSSMATRDLVAKAQILGTPYVTKIVSYTSSIDSKRNYIFSAIVLTAYSVTPQPVSNAI